jgi:uncharacterized membrane protein YhaH (DUF805 family)
MSFGAAISSFFTKYATFSGRARRSEFWFVVLFTSLVSIVISIIAPGPFMEFNGVMVQQQSVLSNLWSLATLIPSLALTWRRLHDVNKSGNYFFFILIPIVGAILLFIQLVKDSAPGANAYGEPVK